MVSISQHHRSCPQPAPRRLLARRILARGILGPLLLALAAMAQGAPELPSAPVRTVTALEAPIRQTLEFAGSVTAERAAALSPATSGLVVELLVDAGARVAKGDVLLRLDSELARYQLQRDEADERRARQAVADAKRRLLELRELARRQTVAQTTVRDLESEVVEDEADLARAEAIARLSRATLARHELLAPFAGVVGQRLTDLGEWITPGGAVLELVSLEDLYIDMQVAESFLGDIKIGMPMTLTLPGREGRSGIDATVATIVPVTDPTARTFLLRARAKATDAVMLPGMSANASLSLATGNTRVTVPRDAVLRYSDGRTVVWIAEQTDGLERARERRVETGLSFEGQVEILSGIDAGDRVVVAGNEALRDGQPIRRLAAQGP
ncbi:MAG: efflux RND transporter periplasmic adaptor subunit [Pseudomonadota bacterium]